MSFDVAGVIGSVMIALGLFSLVFMITKGMSENDAMKRMIVSLFFVLLGGWVLFRSASAELIARKVVGFLTALFGFFMIVFFPDRVSNYQDDSMLKTAILIGIASLVLGLYWLIF